MSHPNLELIDRFFAAYGNRDLRALQEVLDENAVWTFPGHHALSGTHRGIDALVAFFDAMGRVMASAQPTVEKLVRGVHDIPHEWTITSVQYINFGSAGVKVSRLALGLGLRGQADEMAA
ncbi:MAG: nuclear transport factor 2 family protein, partial [Chloroflexota bacterium]|nr:nuclear transport factor 2 family protein [Chloroflexota bacterium]